MKTLQNNFTTPEQSKRLLELGLPADSADCGIVEDIMHGGQEILRIPYTRWCKGYENISTPCWSVGRLLEIMLICDRTTGVFNFLGTDRDLPGVIVRHIDEYLTKYDFSKLEE